MRLGFAGLGLMGRPMAANLCRAGAHLTVYNRSPAPAEALRALGAEVAATPDALFEVCDAVLLMLADDAATDAVLGRGGPDFERRVRGRLIVNMGTHGPAWSAALEADVRAAGGAFVEAPVSGSRGPAEAGSLVAMVAGEQDAVDRARPLLAPMCREVVPVGAVPSAMAMKMAVNLYLVAGVAALAEAATLAGRLGLDLAQFRAVIERGPMRSDVASAKLAKMAARDFEPQAAIRDVCKNSRLIAATAAAAGAHAPLMVAALDLFQVALAAGAGDLDMAAVIDSFAPQEPA